VVVHLVDIGGIVEHLCLNFLFIIVYPHIGTVPQSNRKIIETEARSIPVYT
jgi:hypothetical protein